MSIRTRDRDRELADAMARMAVGDGAEIPQILLALDRGTVMIKFFKRKKVPERRVFCLKTDTFEILQYPMGGKHTLCEEASEYMCWEGEREIGDCSISGMFLAVQMVSSRATLVFASSILCAPFPFIAHGTTALVLTRRHAGSYAAIPKAVTR